MTSSSNLSSRVRQAKSKAIGGKKKRCVKGKSCSATCIAGNKICLVELPDSVSQDIGKARAQLNPQSKSKSKMEFIGDNLRVGNEVFIPGKKLPGSTQPTLYNDKEGKGKWVVKEGGAPGQNNAEKAANDVYKILSSKLGSGGVDSSLVDGKLVNRFVENGKTLDSLSSSDLRKFGIAEKIKKSHLADALVANWDYVGLVNDNMMVGKGGNLVRIDSGGTFNYRAQGGDKKYGAIPMEVWSLRNGQGKQFWANASDRDYRNLWMNQTAAVNSTNQQLRKAINASQLNPSVKQAFGRRIDALEIARQSIENQRIGGSTIAQLADEGKISWKSVDRALEKAFNNASSLDSSSSGWGGSLQREIAKQLNQLV